MIKYLTAEEAQELWCPLKDCHCIVDRCQAWELVNQNWTDKPQKGFCALCHKEEG